MIALKEEYFQTIHPDGKDGVKIKARWYNSIKEFIIEIFETEKEISFTAFLERLHSQFVGELGENAGWFVYQVKLDMEARGLLKHTRSNKSGGRQAKVTMLPSLKKSVAYTAPEKSRSATDVRVNDSVKAKFIELFKSSPMIVHSPGRINLIGEHTDYNNGFV